MSPARASSSGYPLLTTTFRPGKSDDPLAIMLACVQPAIRAEGDAVCAVRFLLPGGDPAVEIDFHDPIVACVGKIDDAVLADGGVGRELVSLAEQGPGLAGHEDLGGLRAKEENRNYRQE